MKINFFFFLIKKGNSIKNYLLNKRRIPKNILKSAIFIEPVCVFFVSFYNSLFYLCRFLFNYITL